MPSEPGVAVVTDPCLEQRGTGIRVHYVTMSFPASSETFATNDVRHLAATGTSMAVHSLRPRGAEVSRLIAERDLQGVLVTHSAGSRTLVRGLLAALRWPHAAASILIQVARDCITTPRHLVVSLRLMPRVLEVFAGLMRDRPDVVHASWAHYPSLLLLLVQRFMPDVVTSISFSAYDIRHRFPITTRVSQGADLVRTLSKGTARETTVAFGLPEERIVVIHDSVDLTLLPPPMPRVRHRILTAGRLVRGKGMDRVLQVFAEVYRHQPDSTLRILGSGPDLGRLRGLADELGIASSVAFVGNVAQDVVLAEMSQSDVFLFLSLDERLPNVVKEAMICGCVCIVSRTPGIEELIEDGVSGFIVEQGDLSSAVAHAIAVLEGRTDSKSIAAAAAARIRAAFDLASNARRYQLLWEDALLKRRRLRGSSPLP